MKPIDLPFKCMYCHQTFRGNDWYCGLNRLNGVDEPCTFSDYAKCPHNKEKVVDEEHFVKSNEINNKWYLWSYDHWELITDTNIVQGLSFYSYRNKPTTH